MQSKTIAAISGQIQSTDLNTVPNVTPCTIAWRTVGTWPSWASILGDSLVVDAPEAITGFFPLQAELFCAEDPDCINEITFNVSLSPAACNAPLLTSPVLQGGQVVLPGLIVGQGGSQNLVYSGDPTIVAALLNAPSGITIASTGANTGVISVASNVAAGTYQATLQLSNGCGSPVNYPVSVTVNAQCEQGEISFPGDGGGGGGGGNCPTTYTGPDDDGNFIVCHLFAVQNLQVVSGDVTAETGVSGSQPALCIRITGGTSGSAYELSYTVNGAACTYSGTAPGGGGGNTGCTDATRVTWDSVNGENTSGNAGGAGLNIAVQSGSQVPSRQVCFDFNVSPDQVSIQPANAGLQIIQWSGGNPPAQCLSIQSNQSAVQGDFNIVVDGCNGQFSIPLTVGDGGSGGGCPAYLQGSGASTDLPNGGCVTVPLDGPPSNPTVLQPAGATVTANGNSIEVCGSGTVGESWVVQLTDDTNCLIAGTIVAGSGSSCPVFQGTDPGTLGGTEAQTSFGNFDQNITSVTVQSSPGGTINATPGIGQIPTGFVADWANVPDGDIVFELNGDSNCTFTVTVENEVSNCTPISDVTVNGVGGGGTVATVNAVEDESGVIQIKFPGADGSETLTKSWPMPDWMNSGDPVWNATAGCWEVPWQVPDVFCSTNTCPFIGQLAVNWSITNACTTTPVESPVLNFNVTG